MAKKETIVRKKQHFSDKKRREMEENNSLVIQAWKQKRDRYCEIGNIYLFLIQLRQERAVCAFS